MKKKISLLLVVVMLLSVFVACNNNKETVEEKPAETPVETAEETTEEETEEVEEEVEEPAEPVEVGAIAKIGLGSHTGTVRSADKGDNPARAQADVTIAAVAFDAEGKIVEAKIDVAQNRISFTEDNTNGVLEENAEYKTKMQLGDDYGMRKASEIGKEYNEQQAAFMEYLKGKTADEVLAIPTFERDENHKNVINVPELASSVTIDIGTYVQVVKEAWDNAVDAAGATKLGLGISVHPAVTEAKDDKNARIQINTYMAALGLDDEGKIVANIIDTVQPRVEVDKEGKVVGASDNVLSKKELKDDYGMRKASEIEKEWFEQMADWEQYTIGKTVAEILEIPVKVRDENHQHVPDVPELATTVTISVEGYQEVMNLAAENAK